MENKKVLLVSYVYPPVSSPGAIRTEKMKKFLPKYNITPHVLTCKNAYSLRMGADKELDNTNIHQVKEWLPQKKVATQLGTNTKKSYLLSFFAQILKAIMIPDRVISWYYPATRYGVKLVKDESIGVVWSTSPSITNHLIASSIAKKTNIPHIVDFRDLWTLEPSYSAKTSLIRKKIEKRIEYYLLRKVSFITVISPVMKKELLTHYNWLHKEQVKVIYNGYDPDDYIKAEKIKLPLLEDKYRLLYAGTFYGKERDPSTLFRAIHNLSKKGLIKPENFEFIILGEDNTYINTLIAKFKIQSFVRTIGSKPFIESLAWMKKANRLFVLTRQGESSKGEMTSKIFDYFGSKVPVLTLTHEYFPIAEITRKTGGVVIEFNDIEAMEAILVDDINHENKRECSYLKEFTRNEAARKLSEIIQA